ERLQTQDPRGEYVLVIQGKSFAEQTKESEENWQQLSIAEHMQHYLDAGVDKKEAMKKVAKDRGVSKRDIYQALLDEE
ncbi:MAG: 16S rRNA (cytidine(1402)-2'-O)-methyltransferase, partial [Lachnospiraceae bacterium]|nr:16S rRNA (cytidine(1402)-2'-O)-methyltransferase [Lachnospiraceae bacterium]